MASLEYTTRYKRDFKRRKYPGLYALARYIPLFALYQEFIASKYAILFLRKKGFYREEISAYKILYPAYSTYIFGAIYELIPSPIIAYFYFPFIGLGHLLGRVHSSIRSRELGELLVDEPEIEKAPKIRTVPLLSVLGGLLLGKIIWGGLWGSLITAVLAYYTCIEILKYRGTETNPPEEDDNVSASLKIEEVINKKVDSIYIIPMCKEDFNSCILLGQAFSKEMVSGKVKALFLASAPVVHDAIKRSKTISPGTGISTTSKVIL